ncbi:hypothetical protein [uncultured Helicobacter sp.]|uniref:hypothetical protein n=1 Tax=uncultured Helicobacter sp. TaxID=175537 RepID=UPI0037508C7A
MRKKTQRVASAAQQKQRRFIFFGAGESGERGIPLFAKKQNNTQNLESIRENATLRNRESTESNAEILGSTESKDSKADSKTITESTKANVESTQSKADSESTTFTESSPIDSQTRTE